MSKKTYIVLFTILGIALLIAPFRPFQTRIQSRAQQEKMQSEYEERKQKEDERTEQAAEAISEALEREYPREFVRARAHKGGTVAVLLDISYYPGLDEMLPGDKEWKAQHLAHDVFLTSYHATLGWTKISIVVKPVGNATIPITYYDPHRTQEKYGSGLTYSMVTVRWENYWDEDWV